jgi:hypothetical protein
MTPNIRQNFQQIPSFSDEHIRGTAALGIRTTLDRIGLRLILNGVKVSKSDLERPQLYDTSSGRLVVHCVQQA